MPAGRQTEFNQDIADMICERLADGESLRAITSDDFMPARSTIFKWLAQNTEFADQYAHARDEQADTLADDMLAIADQYEAFTDKIDVEHIQRAKLRIDTRKWIASKLKPKKYGDKQILSGDSDSPLKFVINVGGE